MKILITVVSLLSAIAAGYGQGHLVSGKILDRNNAPIPGATVHVFGTTIGDVADAAGKFQLENIQSDTVLLEFRSVGYRPKKKKIMIDTGNQQQINVMLDENSLGLDEVVVTGTMKSTFVKASPVKVEVVTGKYVNTFVPAAASSVMEGIKLVSGVQEVVACGVCFTNSISINGLPGPYTAILMDGTPIYGNLAAVYGLNGIPNMIIDRFEVIKGPNSTLYGSEAVAGVINIITKDPETQPLLSVDVMGTSHLESFGNFSLAPSIGKSSGFIGFNYAYINDFDDDNSDDFGDMVNLDRYSLFTKWNIYRPNEKKFTVAAKYFYEDRRNGVEEYVINRNYRKYRGSDSIYGESIYTNRLELFGTYELPFEENIRLDYSFSHHLQDSYYGADYYEAEQGIGFANLIWDKQFNSHAVLLGLTARYQNYDDNTVATSDSTSAGISNAPDKQFIPGVFLQDEWELSEEFTLLTGARLDHYISHGFIFSPRLSMKYKPGKWTTLRGNFGTGFRIVNLFTEDHAFITGQRKVVITEDLKPERSVSGSVNVNHVYTVGNSQGTVDIDGHYTYFFNKIIPDYDDPSKILYSNTAGYAVTKGIGVNITHEFAFPLAGSIGINFQDVTQTERNLLGKQESSKIEFAPEYSGVLAAMYTWDQPQITFGYSLRLTGPMQLPEVYDLDHEGKPFADPRSTRSELYTFHNIQITKEISSSWSLYAGLQNILNYKQPISPLTGYNDPNTPVGFSEHFDTAYAFAPIHGREIYIGIKWDLQKSDQ